MIEHQSRRDAHMPWRALVYKGETWDRYIRNQPRRSRRIPFILSLLLTQHPGVLLKHKRPDDVHALWVYAISVFPPGSPLHRMIMKSVDEPAQELYMTLKEALLARGEKRGQKLGRAQGQKLGRAQGQKLGRAQGQKLGRAQGKAEALLGLLEHREVPVSASVRKRVLATRDELALQRWLARALTVTTAAELFEPEQRRQASTPASPGALRAGLHAALRLREPALDRSSLLP